MDDVIHHQQFTRSESACRWVIFATSKLTAQQLENLACICLLEALHFGMINHDIMRWELDLGNEVLINLYLP